MINITYFIIGLIKFLLEIVQQLCKLYKVHLHIIWVDIVEV